LFDNHLNRNFIIIPELIKMTYLLLMI